VKRDDLPAAERLRVTEIFRSLQGEADAVGWPTVFVRLTGCPLRCGYCDTAYAFHGGEWWTIAQVLDEVARLAGGARATHVCLTGGEPLAQPNALPLLTALCDAGHEVSLETSGAIDWTVVDPRVARVVDVKTPGSGEVARNLLDLLPRLTAHDQLKFVLCGRTDYEWARALVRERELAARCPVLFSPSFGQLEPRALAEWILDDHLPVRFQLQLHKLLWGEARGR
jgi:7-carboxy-7-deazaguanine synthase